MKYDILTESVPGKAKRNEDCFGISRREKKREP